AGSTWTTSVSGPPPTGPPTRWPRPPRSAPTWRPPSRTTSSPPPTTRSPPGCAAPGSSPPCSCWAVPSSPTAPCGRPGPPGWRPPRSRPRGPPLLEELRGGVVGQDPPAGLAGGAVGDRVAGVLDGAGRVAAAGAGLPDAVVHVAGPVGGGAHRAEAPFVGEPLVDAHRDRLGEALHVVAVEGGGAGERRQLGAVADLVGQPPA